MAASSLSADGADAHGLAVPAAILTLIEEFEQSCVASERALRAGELDELDAVLADHRRITHALANEIGSHALDEQADAHVQRRLRRIHAVREDQLVRLLHYRAEIGERLTSIAKMKNVRRAVGDGDHRARMGHLDSLQ